MTEVDQDHRIYPSSCPVNSILDLPVGGSQLAQPVTFALDGNRKFRSKLLQKSTIG